MDWLNFGEVDLINSTPSSPINAQDDNLDMFTFLDDDFSPSETIRLKSKVNQDLNEISRHELSHHRDSSSFVGNTEFQDNEVADMYESLLSEDLPANPSESPFFELEKVTEVGSSSNDVKSPPYTVDEGTRDFLQAIENFLSNGSHRSFGLRDMMKSSFPSTIKPAEDSLMQEQEERRIFKSRIHDDDVSEKLHLEKEEKCCDMNLGSVIPKEENAIAEDSSIGTQIHDKSSKETFRIANISEFVDRTNGRNIIILIADNQSQTHDPGKLPYIPAAESFEISSSSNHIHLLKDASSSSQQSEAEEPSSKRGQRRNVPSPNNNELDSSSLSKAATATTAENNNNTTGTNNNNNNQHHQSSNQAGEHLGGSPRDEPAQEPPNNDLMYFPPRMGGTLTSSCSSSYSSSSSCSSSPKSFHFKKSPQSLLGSSGGSCISNEAHHLLLSPSQQLKSPSSPPLPLILPKRGKRTLQERRKIKKWQNIEAARRYRDRKKLEMETSITQVKILEAANKQLYEKMDVLSNKVSSLKKILSRLGLLT